MHGARKPQPRKTNHAVTKSEAVYAGGRSPSAAPWDASAVFDTFFGMLGEEPFTHTRTFPVTAHEPDVALDIGNESHWGGDYFIIKRPIFFALFFGPIFFKWCLTGGGVWDILSLFFVIFSA